MPKEVINKIGKGYHGAIRQFTGKGEILAGEKVGEITPMSYKIVMDDSRFVIIHKGMIQAIYINKNCKKEGKR
jgi:hypothetical protein